MERYISIRFNLLGLASNLQAVEAIANTVFRVLGVIAPQRHIELTRQFNQAIRQHEPRDRSYRPSTEQINFLSSFGLQPIDNAVLMAARRRAADAVSEAIREIEARGESHRIRNVYDQIGVPFRGRVMHERRAKRSRPNYRE